jgi:hypothetical protein
VCSLHCSCRGRLVPKRLDRIAASHALMAQRQEAVTAHTRHIGSARPGEPIRGAPTFEKEKTKPSGLGGRARPFGCRILCSVRVAWRSDDRTRFDYAEDDAVQCSRQQDLGPALGLISHVRSFTSTSDGPPEPPEGYAASNPPTTPISPIGLYMSLSVIRFSFPGHCLAHS